MTERWIHSSAVLDHTKVGQRVSIGAHVVVFPNVEIEDDVTIFPGTVIGRPPMVAGIVPPKTADLETVIRRGAVIGSNATIYRGVRIGEEVLIGDGVRIRENTSIGYQSVIGSNSTLQNDVQIGQRVRVVDLSHITAGVVVENDVFWSVGVLSMNDNRDGEGLKPPTVAEGAFLGGGAILLPGVYVGPRSIVAAGSVVTRDVEPDIRVQGVPAKRFFPQPTEENGYTDPSYDGYRLYPHADD